MKPDFQCLNSSLPLPQNMACVGRSPFLLQRSDDGSNSYKGEICSFDDNTLICMTIKITEGIYTILKMN